MTAFKKASEIKENKNGIQRSSPPEIKTIILKHLKSFNNPVTVTSTLIELNRNGLNPSRGTVRKYLDKMAESGFVKVHMAGNICEFELIKR